MPSDSYARIYAIVRRIPKGRVATYGQVAALAGLPHAPRVAGYALHALPDGSPIPWHRVVAAGGKLSLGRLSPHGAITQRLRLEKEGVRFDARGCADMKTCRWSAGLDETPARRGVARKPARAGGTARSVRRTLACLAALGALLAWGSPARAGYPDPPPRSREPSRWLMGLGVGALHPLGAFAHDAGVSPVVDVVVARELGASRGYGLRLGISATSYSSARREYALPGIKLGVRTSNLLTAVTLGPQVSLTRGRWTGVAHAGPGVTWFTTQTSAGDAYAAGKNNFQSACLAGEAGGAVQYRLTRGLPRVLIEAGGRTIVNAETRYVPASGVDVSGTELQLSPRRGGTQVVEWRIGVLFSADPMRRKPPRVD